MNRPVAVATAAACLMLAACVPWTVRPIDEAEAGGPFDAARYVDSIWNAKVLLAVNSGARDLGEALAHYRAGPARAPQALLVKGEGKVLRVDDTSRSGLLLVDLPPYDGRADVAVQIGPLVRGTALRDALPFVQFSQFVNQLDFARAASALNDRAVKTALAGFAPAGAAGANVSFTGAAAFSAEGLPEIVPVSLSLTRGAR